MTANSGGGGTRGRCSTWTWSSPCCGWARARLAQARWTPPAPPEALPSLHPCLLDSWCSPPSLCQPSPSHRPKICMYFILVCAHFNKKTKTKTPPRILDHPDGEKRWVPEKLPETSIFWHTNIEFFFSREQILNSAGNIAQTTRWGKVSKLVPVSNLEPCQAIWGGSPAAGGPWVMGWGEELPYQPPARWEPLSWGAARRREGRAQTTVWIRARKTFKLRGCCCASS